MDVRRRIVLGRRGYPAYPVVRSGEGLQRAGDGPARSLPGGPLQLLLPPVHDEDRADAGGPDDRPDRVRSQQELYSQVRLNTFRKD